MESEIDYWRTQELKLAMLAMAAAEVLSHLINGAEDGADLGYLHALRQRMLDAADAFSPPGEPEEGYQGNVISLDSYRARLPGR